MTCSQGGFCGKPICETKISYITYICKTLVPFINISPEICTMGAFGITAGSAYFFMSTGEKKTNSASTIKFKYEPTTGSPLNSFYKVEPSEKMIGDSDLNNVMIANEDTKHVWAKNIAIVDLRKATTNEVNIYYSLCSTKITDGKVGIIRGFNKDLHKPSFFCSKNSPTLEEFFIIHKKFDNQNHTCIEARQDTVVCLVGDIEFSANNIGITNKTYVDSVLTDAII